MMNLASMVLTTGGACAFPSMRDRIPNGYRVPCPPGIDGCDGGDDSTCQPQVVCNGVGHASCRGGSLPLNPFGQDLRNANSVWTRELCEMDSDGDGLTNGQELGDPCCLWRRSDDPSEYTKSFTPSHPGIANTDAEVAAMPNVTDCGCTAPAAMGSPMNQFNDGEEQLVMNLYVDNFELSSARTTYVDIAMNMPASVLDAHEIYHAVWGTAIVDKVANLHHYVIRACSRLWPADLNGREISRSEATANDCMQWGGWTPGSDVVSTPAWAGLPFGRGVGIVSFSVNIHYDNPTEQSGIVDSSGFQLWYTPDLRPHKIYQLPAMIVSTNPMILVPPGVRRWFFTRECVLTIQDQATDEPAEVHLTGVTYHAHLLGREMYTEYWPVGDEVPIDLASAPVWHFDDQGTRNIINWNISLRTGDRLQTTCVMDSSGRSESTQFAEETTDEMCWATFFGWPSTTNGVRHSCSGSMWSGTLAPSEPGFGLADRHPEAQARNVWDGTNMLTAGNALRLQGRPPAGCTDSSSMCGFISTRLTTNPNFTCMTRENASSMLLSLQQDMGSRISASFSEGTSVLEVCCATFCQLMCSENRTCQTTDTSMPEIPEPEELGPEAWADVRVRSMVTCMTTATVCSEVSNGDDASSQSSTSRMGESSAARIVALPLLVLVKHVL